LPQERTTKLSSHEVHQNTRWLRSRSGEQLPRIARRSRRVRHWCQRGYRRFSRLDGDPCVWGIRSHLKSVTSHSGISLSEICGRCIIRQGDAAVAQQKCPLRDLKSALFGDSKISRLPRSEERRLRAVCDINVCDFTV